MEKVNKKSNYIVFNMFYSLSRFAICWILFTVFCEFSEFQSWFLALLFYLIEVNQQVNEDFLKEEISRINKRIDNK